MNNYLLSIDPSIKNTGFTLWEKQKIIVGHEEKCKCKFCSDNQCNIWKPILIKSYSFKKYTNRGNCLKKCNCEWNIKIISHINDRIDYLDNLNLIIERGFNNMRGSETLDHLRGFIAGIFNKLLTKDMLISPKEWKNWYKNRPIGAYWDIKNEKWTKQTSLAMVQIIINENEWDFNITNHNEADSLLIGWYYLNKENK